MDNRDSDLCAQWKAADAAQQSANWTGIGVIVGALTLAAASVAAWYAREAARHTEIGAVQAERSADAGEAAITVTRETGQAQVRGYLFVEYLKGSVSKSRISIDAKVRCVGQSPIRSVEMRCVIRVGFKDGEATYSDFGREGRMITVLRGVDIAPGDGDFVSRKYEISQFESENLDAIVAVGGNAVIQPLIILSYEDVFGHTIFERQKWSSSAGFGSRLRSIEFAFDGSEGITIDEMPKIT